MKIVMYFYGAHTYIQRANVLVDEHCRPINYTFDTSIPRKPLPRITVCGVYDSETNKLSIGVSRCSPKDLFSKEIGRKLAQERAETKPVCVVDILPNEVISHVFFSLARTMENRYTLTKSVSF